MQLIKWLKGSRWEINFPLIYLAYLGVLLYFVIWQFSWVLVGILLASLLLGFKRKYWIIFPLLIILAGWVGYWKLDEKVQTGRQPGEISHIRPILDSLEVNGSLLSFRGKSEGRLFQVHYTIRNEEEKEFWKNLDHNVEIQFSGQVKKPEGKRNFKGFDYQKYLASQGIYHLVKITDITRVRPISSFLDLHVLRRKAILWGETWFPSPMSAYVTGLLFGYLPKDFEKGMGDVYSSLGIIHLFALSGMQVNFFIGRFRWGLLRAGLSLRLVGILQILFSYLYAFLTGLAPSVLRALIQNNIRIKGMDNLAVTFLVLIILMPKFLLTSAGQLSLLYALVLGVLSGKFRHLKGLNKLLLESMALSLGVLPLLILNFHVFQPLSIFLTLGFSLVFDLFILPLLVVAFILSFFGFFLNINFIFLGLEGLVHLIGEGFKFPLVFGSPGLICFLTLLVVTGLLIDFYRQPRWTVPLGLSLIFVLVLSKYPSQPSITMVDVGQGDAIFLQDAWNRTNILIDLGGQVNYGGEKWQESIRDANAEKTLIPFLQSQGVGRIDTLILTHTDMDHVGDLIPLSEKIKIQEIWISKGSLTKPSFVKVLKTVDSKVHVAKVGDAVPIFDSNLEVLTGGYTGDGGNNDSLVTYGKFFGKSFLFTGDLEEEGEAALLRDYPHLRVDVLKVGHHGSKTSSSSKFITSIKPKIALISDGLDNRFGHPNQETLATLNKNKVEVHRTDFEGGIRLSPKGRNGWSIETVKSPQKTE